MLRSANRTLGIKSLNHKKLYIGALFFICTLAFAAQAQEAPGFEPSWLSLLPPVVAIILALITKQTLISLFAGIWIGVSLLAGNPITGLTTALDTYIVGAVADTGHASILLFSMAFGGIIGLVSANGGMKGIIEATSRYAKSGRSGQLTTAFMGILIFFDDYANTLLVGNMMRPFTDKLRISREKLSYIVDSTAAPIASIAVISTWSVFQMSLLDGPYQYFNIQENTYITFLRSIPYSFYCILTIFFVLLNIWMRREYGPMHAAQLRSRETGAVLSDTANPMLDPNLMDEANINRPATHWTNGGIPIITVIFLTFLGLFITGRNSLGDVSDYTIRDIVSGSDSYAALMWAAYITSGIGILLSVGRKILSLQEALDAWLNGLRSLVLACCILVLGWTMGKVCEVLNTADYLVSLSSGILTPELLPAVTFLTAAAISFSTGSSWATMAIMVPIVAPMSIELMEMEANVVIQSPVFLSTFASILSGAVFGDHCSPISDTTILSSTASGADHIDHVRTQLPYALTTGGIALFFGYLMVGYGYSYWLSIGLGIGSIILVLKLFGKPLPRTQLK